MTDKPLYDRLGGYDAIMAVVGDLLPRLQGDEVLGRFWQNRSDDGLAREKQLLIDFLSSASAGRCTTPAAICSFPIKGWEFPKTTGAGSSAT